MSEKLYAKAADEVRKLGLVPLGYLPKNKAFELPERHLGLVTAGEIKDLKERVNQLAVQLEKSVDIDGIISIAKSAAMNGIISIAKSAGNSAAATGNIQNKMELATATATAIAATPASAATTANVTIAATPASAATTANVTIAVSDDEAFCFMYRENLLVLEQLGCRIVKFSPIHDERLPENIDGLFLCGGYPELYAEKLSKNRTMLESVRSAVLGGLPTIAECGGFMYLTNGIWSEAAGPHRKLENMCGVISGTCENTGKLGRFGYVYMKAEKDGLLCKKGEVLKAHEFHYYDASDAGNDFYVEKADGSRSWQAAFMTDTFYAGYPHLNLLSAPDAAKRFVNACRMQRFGIAKNNRK